MLCVLTDISRRIANADPAVTGVRLHQTQSERLHKERRALFVACICSPSDMVGPSACSVRHLVKCVTLGSNSGLARAAMLVRKSSKEWELTT